MVEEEPVEQVVITNKKIKEPVVEDPPEKKAPVVEVTPEPEPVEKVLKTQGELYAECVEFCLPFREDFFDDSSQPELLVTNLCQCPGQGFTQFTGDELYK